MTKQLHIALAVSDTSNINNNNDNINNNNNRNNSNSGYVFRIVFLDSNNAPVLEADDEQIQKYWEVCKTAFSIFNEPLSAYIVFFLLETIA